MHKTETNSQQIQKWEGRKAQSTTTNKKKNPCCESGMCSYPEEKMLAMADWP